MACFIRRLLVPAYLVAQLQKPDLGDDEFRSFFLIRKIGLTDKVGSVPKRELSTNGDQLESGNFASFGNGGSLDRAGFCPDERQPFVPALAIRGFRETPRPRTLSGSRTRL